mgnify:CR=1 FL=1
MSSYEIMLSESQERMLIVVHKGREAEVKAGRNPIFQSHMWDGSAVPLAENIEIARELLPRMKNINAILEVEIGVVGDIEEQAAIYWGTLAIGGPTLLADDEMTRIADRFRSYGQKKKP